MIRPNAEGKISTGQRIRASASRWFFEDRIAPVSQREIEQSQDEHH